MQASERLVDRIVILAEDTRRVQLAREPVAAYLGRTDRPCDVWSVSSVESCLSLMDRYINVIILNYAGQPKERAIPTIAKLREVYDGRIFLVNEDPSLSGCEWGRRYGVDYHMRQVEELRPALARVLDAERRRGQTALVLAGGGILGGFNEAGSLKALYDFGIRDFDMYIGISAGSIIGACAANGASPEELIDHEMMGALDFYYPNYRELFHKLRRFVPNTIRGLADYLSTDNSDGLFTLSGLLTPSAFLSNAKIMRKLKQLIRMRGGTNSFRVLRERGKKLYVMAVDLDAATTRVFGEEDDLNVPITQACAASCALPMCYAPAHVEGRCYTDGAVARTAGLDVAVRNGADLVVCINPLVPYTGGRPGFIQSLGLVGILEQAYRSMLQTRLHQAVEAYRLSHPHVTIILIEPDPKNRKMFHNPLNASERLIRQAALDGYLSTRKTIEARFDFLKRAFHYHGRPITREIGDEEFETLVQDIGGKPEADPVRERQQLVFE